MKTKNVLIGLGLLAVGITTIVLVVKHKKEIKGAGEVSAETKKDNKITFVKK